jgi:hypothetical protein
MSTINNSSNYYGHQIRYAALHIGAWLHFSGKMAFSGRFPAKR